MKKVVVVLSGGMDSGVLLASLAHTGGKKEIHALTFNYGSNHAKQEIAKAKILAKKYANYHVIIPLKFIKGLFKSSLLSGAKEIPEGHYQAENMKSTVVPFRNGIMLSIAIGYAESIGAEKVMIGAHSGDHYIYPDCRPEFLAAIKAAARLGTFTGVTIVSPFKHMSKRDIGNLGESIKFNFSYTYTCYKGRKKHCGKCGSCVERKEALEGFDTTTYEEEK